MSRCSVCGGALGIALEAVFDDRYGHPKLFSVAACRECGHGVTLPSLTEEELPALYGAYYPRRSTDIPALAEQVGEPSLPSQRMRRWLMGTDNQGQYLARPGMNVLDYGCGAAVSLLEIEKLGGKAYGIEADPNVKAIADHYDLNIHIGRIEDNPFPGVEFDLIILNQVVEHLPDPAKLLRSLVGRLAAGGRIVLSFPNAGSIYCRLFGSRWINWHIPYHLQHFNRESFTRFARSNGLRILSSRTVTPNLWTVLQFRTLWFPATRGVPNPMWGGATPTLPNGAVYPPPFGRKVGNYARRLLLKVAKPLIGGVICVVNRAIDGLGWGDSVIAVLQPEHSAK